MLKIIGDIHLGLSRTANTTQDSRRKLQEYLYTAAMKAVSGDVPTVQLGDVVDRAFNAEYIIRQAGEVVSKTALTLAGNHDMVPDSTKLTTLQLVDQYHPGIVAMAPYGEVEVDIRTMAGHRVVSIPHHTSQQLFEQALDRAEEVGTADSVLLLHTNYNLGYELTDETLNLTKDRASNLCGVYGFVISGHEHNFSNHFGGKLIMLGNIFPTSFSDISNKFTATLDDNGLHFDKVWDAAEGYAEYQSDSIPESTPAEFVEITGEIEPGDLAALSRSVRRIWKNSPGLLGLRLNTQSKALASVPPSKSKDSLLTLPDIIRNDLTNRPELKTLWEEFAA